MKTLTAFIFSLAVAWPVAAQTYTPTKINALTELSAEPDSGDLIPIWDLSAATTKKITRANFLADSITPEVFGLTDPGADRLLYWDASAGVYRHLTLGTGLSISDTTINAEVSGGSSSLTSAQIAFGAADNTITSEAGFEYDATFNHLRIPTMVSLGATGSAFAMYTSGSGSLTMFNDFTDETLIWNLGVGGANTAFLTSDSGVNLIDTGTIDIKVPTEVYDATGWNGDLTVPTKDAVRDKIEALTIGAAGLSSTWVGYGDGTNVLTGEAGFEYNETTNTLSVPNFSTTNFSTTNLNADNLLLIEESGAGTQTLQITAGSSYAANRTLNIFGPDSDVDLTIPNAGTATLAATNVTQTWGDGVKQTFNPNATNAGVNVGSHAGDPSSPANGDLWYDSTANELTARINGSNVALGAGGGGGSVATDTIWDAKGDLAVGTGSNTASKLTAGTNGYVLTADSAEATGLKWAAPSGGSLSLASYRSTSVIWDEMLYNGSFAATYKIGPFGFLATLSGTGAAIGAVDAILADNKTNGQINLESGTAASTSYSSLTAGTAAFSFNTTSPTASYELETRVFFSTGNVQTASTDEYTFRFGFIDTATSAAVVDGAWFEFGPSDTDWQIKTASNTSNVSTADTGLAVAEGTWYRLTITVNAAADSIGFFVNGTEVTGSPLTNTTNIPRTAARFTGISIQCIKGAGATEADVNVDYIGLATTYGTSR